MARQPVQTGLTRALQAQAAQAATSKRYLADQLSRRVGQSEFAAAQARIAAAAAQTAAAAAQAAAAAASSAAAGADAQAGAAASAAASASAAAATANDRVAVLELTDLYTSDGAIGIADVPTSDDLIPGMHIEPGGELLRLPHLCNLSLEIRPKASPNKIQVSIGLRTNVRQLNLSDRSVICTDGMTMETSYSFIPVAGETYIEAIWRRSAASGFNEATSVAGRRQLSVLRIGTP